MPTAGQPSTYRASRSSCLTLRPLTNLMASTLRGVFGQGARRLLSNFMSIVLSNLRTDPLRASSLWRGLRKEPPPPSVTGDHRADERCRTVEFLPSSSVRRRAARRHLVAPVVG